MINLAHCDIVIKILKNVQWKAKQVIKPIYNIDPVLRRNISISLSISMYLPSFGENIYALDYHYYQIHTTAHEIDQRYFYQVLMTVFIFE